MMYAVVTDRTPSRCTIAAIEDTLDDARAHAERLDTGVNGMPAEVLQVAPGDPGNLEPGDRAWHDGVMCWSGAGKKETHWGYGSGMVGCLFDYGPHFVSSRDHAIDGVLCVFEDDLSEDELRDARSELEADGIYYFNDRASAGADYCQIWEADGPCPEDDE